MTIADAVWVATAQLHRDDSSAQDFSVREIMEKATSGKLVSFTPGLQVHVSKHCVANKSPNSEQHRMLFATERGRRRLFRPGDPFHADRSKGKTHPERPDLPIEYRELIDWYESAYSRPGQSPFQVTPEPNPVPSELAAGISPPVATGENLLPSVTAFVSSGGALVIPESLRQALGVREGDRFSIRRSEGGLIIQPVNSEFVDRVAGSYRGKTSMVEARERDHRIER
jgi:bifunctional DNA-binding transcriptional regulator/antitoxin component of YhaV-PrlF toxin-antitoxin module